MVRSSSSFVWDYLDAQGGGYVCKLCGKGFISKSTGGTAATARNHLGEKHGLAVNLLEDGVLEMESEADKALSTAISRELPSSWSTSSSRATVDLNLFDFKSADEYREFKLKQFEEWEAEERARMEKCIRLVKDEAAKKIELARATFVKRKAEEKLRELEKQLRAQEKTSCVKRERAPSPECITID